MAADAAASGCWCFDVTMSPESLELVPKEARGIACICARCASAPAVVADK
jgi:hypothetical protein